MTEKLTKEYLERAVRCAAMLPEPGDAEVVKLATSHLEALQEIERLQLVVDNALNAIMGTGYCEAHLAVIRTMDFLAFLARVNGSCPWCVEEERDEARRIAALLAWHGEVE